MKKSEWKNALRHSFTVLSPDDFETVLSECERKGRIPMTENKTPANRRKPFRYVLLAGALVAILVSGLVIGNVLNRKTDPPPEATPAPITEQTTEKTSTKITPTSEKTQETTQPETVVPTEKTPDAVPEIVASVYLDVNPGLRFELAKDKTVADVAATNKDGEAFVDGIKSDALGKTLNDALGSAVAQLTGAGSISKANDTVLLAVVADDQAEAVKISGSASFAIKRSMSKNGIYGNVVTCSVQPTKRVMDLVDDYVISVSKASFIIRLIDFDPAYPTERLVSMTINELVALCKEWNVIGWCDINVTAKEALETAAADVGISVGDVILKYRHSQVEVLSEPDRNICLWSLWVADGENNYGYHIDAATGEIRKKTGPTVLPDEQAVTQLITERYTERGIHVSGASSLGDLYQLYFMDYSDSAEPVCRVQIYTDEGVYTVSYNVVTGEDTLLNFLETKQAK